MKRQSQQAALALRELTHSITDIEKHLRRRYSWAVGKYADDSRFLQYEPVHIVTRRLKQLHWLSEGRQILEYPLHRDRRIPRSSRRSHTGRVVGALVEPRAG